MSYYKRIIYCLYFKDNNFYLSRNFSLQRVGDLNWLIKNFEFSSTSIYIDELIVILVKKNPDKLDFVNFFKNVENLKKNIFMPIILGGGIKSLDLAKNFFENGADKILVNTISYENKYELDVNTYTSLASTSSNYTISDGVNLTVAITKETKTYYDYQVELNDDKREIIILKPEFLSSVEEEFRNVMSDIL